MAGLITALVLQLLSVVEPDHPAKAVAHAITARATRDVGYFSFASKLPDADGVFLDTRELLRPWAGPRRVFLVVRRSPSQRSRTTRSRLP